MFDGPNIVLKLHVDRDYTLQDIAIFIFGPFGLKLPILRVVLGDKNKTKTKTTVLGRKHVQSAINRENLSTGSTWARARE